MTTVLAAALTRPLPLCRTVQVVDLWRAAAIASLPAGGDYPALTGTLHGRPVTGSDRQHQHAHWLPVTGDGQTLAGVAVWAPGGLTDVECAAVGAVRRLSIPGLHTSLRPVRVAGFGGGRVWTSLTPYVQVRYRRRVTDDIAAECTHRGLPVPRVDRVAYDDWGPGWVLARPSRADRPTRQAHPFRARLTFPHPVPGPLALGHLAHFGLGLFTPQEDR